MKRLVSYIYKYENGSKGENIGFGKIDTEDNRIKMNISLRCNENKEHLEVYFFVREDATKLVFVGNATQNNGRYELKKIVDIRNLTEGKYSTSDIHGIIIKDDINIRFISFWKEEYIIRKCVKWNEIMVMDISGKANSRNNITDDSYEVIEEDTVYMVDRNCVPIEPIMNNENPGIDGMEIMGEEERDNNITERNDQIRKDNMSEESNRIGKSNIAEEDKSENSRKGNITEERERHSISSESIKNESDLSDYIKESREGAEKERLEKTENNNGSPSMLERLFGKERIEQYVIDNNKLSACKIVPKDIYVLPRCCWNNVRNAYLCHCFMKYGGAYLIEADGLYIGVPGYKTINDEIMAGKYGFKHFMECKIECLGVSSNMNWKRGFWCKKLMSIGNRTS